jgi:hypothetical protein
MLFYVITYIYILHSPYSKYVSSDARGFQNTVYKSDPLRY